MKTYNTKLAIGVFTVITAFNAALFVLEQGFQHGSYGFDLGHAIASSLGMLWWSVNFVGYPVMRYATAFHSSMSSLTGMMIGCGLLSALLWSAVAGFVFRRRYAA